MCIRIVRQCPNLNNEPYQKTSEATDEYNCIAFAGDDFSRWWQPLGGTPEGGDFENPYWHKAGQENVVRAYREQFAILGYEEVDDGSLDLEFEKVCLFVDGWQEPTHMAKQTIDGKWKSKCGTWEDIEHTLVGLTGDYYGSPTIFFQRERRQ